jgi:hypothetical protein
MHTIRIHNLQNYTKVYKTYNHVHNDKNGPKEHHYTATLRYTSPKYTSLNLATLHFLAFALHYPLIWLNPITFRIVLFHLTSLN